jgi:hypothetical protein
MSDFIIPKGREFNFTVKVIEADSFLAQDLSDVEITDPVGQFATFNLALKSDPDKPVFTPDIYLTVPAGSDSPAVDEVSQVTLVTIDDQVTANEIFTLIIGTVATSYTAKGAVYNDEGALVTVADTNVTVTAALLAALGDSYQTTATAVSTTSFSITADSGYPIFEISAGTLNMVVDTIVIGVEAVEAVSSNNNALNGMLEGKLSATQTKDLVPLRGPIEDGYYLKSGYTATIEVKFEESSNIPNIVTVIEDVYVTPTGA